jgi:hypothetical protein
MRREISFVKNVCGLVIGFAFLTVTLGGCAHRAVGTSVGARPKAEGLKEVKAEKPVALRLKAEVGRIEKVDYYHHLLSRSFEEGQVRHQKEESVEFTSQADTLKVDSSGEFTQVITILHKDGSVDLHGFALPEPGEKLEITANGSGKILKASGYPLDSIFYVPPISLPKDPVNVGDTWTLQANWSSLEDGVPFHLDMASILKGLWTCGKDTCAEIEVSGGVTLQPPANQVMGFKSIWRGKIYFAINAGTVVWSRTDSEETFAAEKVYRKVDSCLEAALSEPADIRLPGVAKPACEPLPPAPGTELIKPVSL